MSKRLRLKPYYSVTELAAMAGCHRVTMWRRLKARGVEFGDARKLPLSALKIALADFWEALELARQLTDDGVQ